MGVLPHRCCLSAAFALFFFAAAFVAECAWIGHGRVLLPAVIGARRRLVVGPGSSPPSCRERCRRCSPCRPVRVAIHPAGRRIVPQEYYPEAWRCKCGNELFMP